MGVRSLGHLLGVAIACGLAGAPAISDAAEYGRGSTPEIRQPQPPENDYARGEDVRQRRGKGARTGSVLALQRGGPPSYAESAFSTGYEDGYAHGVADGRAGDRYDPVRHRDYRDADRGYHESYGSREAYRNNYRAGFRQGYENGYRAGSRHGR